MSEGEGEGEKEGERNRSESLLYTEMTYLSVCGGFEVFLLPPVLDVLLVLTLLVYGVVVILVVIPVNVLLLDPDDENCREKE